MSFANSLLTRLFAGLSAVVAATLAPASFASVPPTYAVAPVAVSALQPDEADRLPRAERQRALEAVRGEYELKNGAVMSFGGTANRPTVQIDQTASVVLRARSALDYQSLDGALRVRFTEANNGNVTSVKVSMR